MGGAGTQQSPCGGLSAAYLSFACRLLGRLATQMWSWESTKIPPMPPSIQLLGRGLGQYGSGSNFGTLLAADVLTANRLSPDRKAAKAETAVAAAILGF